jgi:hypothetical protein
MIFTCSVVIGAKFLMQGCKRDFKRVASGREATSFIYLERYSDNNSTTYASAQEFRFDGQFDGNWRSQLFYELSYHLKLQFIADATGLNPSFTAPLGFRQADLLHPLFFTLLNDYLQHHSRWKITKNWKKLEKVSQSSGSQAQMASGSLPFSC